ncbi:basic blue protein-like [Miscanthus floridulus]|uniref:basic blue protein-like n=1 Tax=Miscanthus floridulus TaxID=154761 RepID=UPI00345B26F6
MASRTALLITAAMAVVVVGALLPATASAEDYMVGDDDGWHLHVDYNAWASGKTFRVGDKLEFVYSVGYHNVVILDDAASYEACTVPSDALKLTSGDDSYELSDAGEFFFICGFEGHCQSGMKFKVIVQ